MYSILVTTALLLASAVNAHGGVTTYTIDGQVFKGYQTMAKGASDTGPDRLKTKPPGGATIQHEWKQLHPIREMDSKLLACNSPGTPGKIAAPVKAGGTVKAQWSQWPHNSGPVLVYMADCGAKECSSVQPSSLEWFKIYGSGLVSGTSAKGKWAAGEMVKNSNSLSVEIPLVKPGNYLIRHETINLAQSNPEFYMECAALKVTGSGTLVPPASVKVKFPGGYSKEKGTTTLLFISMCSDTLILSFPDPQLFRTSAGAMKDTPNWAVPGPPVWPGSAAGVAETSKEKAAPQIGKGKSLFFDESEFVDITWPAPEDN
ncbi:hypothetical protein EJ08DRAFT_591505 [Tothia fuscella]|uniref:AA9 family lytic polysaccharide monooxygenase n=1 Tax=Tothia fuscella TaxID=1048955 RepID=A0A9P4NNB0_9PEZI|nr:hypothetical protein EJ08DRAFT_591505 [Tothia fuscella]